MATKAEKAAARAAKVQAAKDAKAAKAQAVADAKAAAPVLTASQVRAQRVSTAGAPPKPPVPKVSPVVQRRTAFSTRIAELKTQDANGHKVTPAQLDELMDWLFTDPYYYVAPPAPARSVKLTAKAAGAIALDNTRQKNIAGFGDGYYTADGKSVVVRNPDGTAIQVFV